MQLSKSNLEAIKSTEAISLPGEEQLNYPETVLQFGTGVLLRGLPDFFIDKANKQGVFKGRIVVVKSTDSGSADAFAEQDGLYTQCIRGIENGVDIDEYVVNASISRVVSAKSDWNKILEFAKKPELRLVISNTTELGIVPGEDKITDLPPSGFPGKLLAVLHERYKALGEKAAPGLVIVPTELIVDNAEKLRAIVLDLAQKNNLGANFINWVQEQNHFCSSLVDRIVPGKLESVDDTNTTSTLGYTDELKFMSEVFRLWAIESDAPEVKEVLSFATVDDGVVIAPSIEKFRELKLRLLNGTHTFACGLAILAGFETVKEAMADQAFEAFIEQLTKKEIAPVLAQQGIDYGESCAFADKVIERFKNPYLNHKWLSISFAFTSKMVMRNWPLIKGANTKAPENASAMALGFAAYLLFMRSKKVGANYMGSVNGVDYKLNDDKAAVLSEMWEQNGEENIVTAVLSDSNLWGTDLNDNKIFADQVRYWLPLLINDGAKQTLNKFVATEAK